MSERKVLNKYIPQDFDPTLIPRIKKPKNAQQKVTLMAPFTMRCNTCGEYIHKGKKFNARKETAEGEYYHNIKILRLYIKCTLCSAEITFKTDPQNAYYAVEHGAVETRSFQLRGTVDKEEKLEEEEIDPITTLENRSVASRIEMEIEDALHDVRVRNARSDRFAKSADLYSCIASRENEEQKLLEEEDEKLVQYVFPKVQIVQRKADDSEPDLHSLLPKSTHSLIISKVTPQAAVKKKKINGKASYAIKGLKKDKTKM